MRRKNDQYFTPHSFTKALLNHLPKEQVLNSHFFEPCVGDGDIQDLVVEWVFSAGEENRMTHSCNDIDKKFPATWHLNAKKDTVWKNVDNERKFYTDKDLSIITNPPYGASVAPILEQANASKWGLIAMLLRISFLEPCNVRVELQKQMAPYLRKIILLPRHSFTGDGKTDMQPLAWFIWNKQKLSDKEFTEVIHLGRNDLKAFE